MNGLHQESELPGYCQRALQWVLPARGPAPFDSGSSETLHTVNCGRPFSNPRLLPNNCKVATCLQSLLKQKSTLPLIFLSASQQTATDVLGGCDIHVRQDFKVAKKRLAQDRYVWKQQTSNDLLLFKTYIKSRGKLTF